jgi:hypothetical protein
MAKTAVNVALALGAATLVGRLLQVADWLAVALAVAFVGLLLSDSPWEQLPAAPSWFTRTYSVVGVCLGVLVIPAVPGWSFDHAVAVGITVMVVVRTLGHQWVSQSRRMTAPE